VSQLPSVTHAIYPLIHLDLSLLHCTTPSLLQLTQPVFDMLDRVSSIGSSDLANAQALVSNVSSSVQKMSDSIQAAAVDKVDSFQTAYLGKAANGTAPEADQGTAALVKAVHAVYYVSKQASLGCRMLR
jgi:hypothetical protein